MNTDTTVTGRDIRSDHFRGLKAKNRAAKRQEVMDAALLAHAQGRRDFTCNELCIVMEGQAGHRVSPSDLTATIDALLKSGLLAANYHHGRACSVTGSTKVRTLYVVAQQAGLRLAPAKADIHAVTAVRAVVTTASAAAACPAAETARSSGAPPDVRAYRDALKAKAARGR